MNTLNVRKYFTCETKSNINKIMRSELVHILGEIILLLTYDFGKQ